MIYDALLDIDGHGRPLYGEYPFKATKALTFTGSNTTVAADLWQVTGVVQIGMLWGVCTTAFGNAHTNAHFRVNDQTASDQIITKATTLDLSSISAGAAILKTGLITAVATYKTSDAASFYEPTTLQTNIFTPFVVVQKKGGIQTDIEYVYTTTNTPTTGAMTFEARYYPLSEGACLTPA